MKEKLFKKATKVLGVVTLVLSITLGCNSSFVYAANVKSDSYGVYYNSPGSYSMSDTCKITYYAGTNYFTIDSLSGSSGVKIVTCTGVNVNLSTTVSRTSTGSKSFTCKLKSTSYTEAQFKIKATNEGYSTMYASGRIYFN